MENKRLRDLSRSYVKSKTIIDEIDFNGFDVNDKNTILENIGDIHAYKIADILPVSEDDVKAIFAKERFTLSESEIKDILKIVGKYYIE